MAAVDGCDFVQNSLCFPPFGTEMTRLHRAAQMPPSLPLTNLISVLLHAVLMWFLQESILEKVLQTAENLFWKEKSKSSEMASLWFVAEALNQSFATVVPLECLCWELLVKFGSCLCNPSPAKPRVRIQSRMFVYSFVIFILRISYLLHPSSRLTKY